MLLLIVVWNEQKMNRLKLKVIERNCQKSNLSFLISVSLIIMITITSFSLSKSSSYSSSSFTIWWYHLVILFFFWNINSNNFVDFFESMNPMFLLVFGFSYFYFFIFFFFFLFLINQMPWRFAVTICSFIIRSLIWIKWKNTFRLSFVWWSSSSSSSS